MSALKTKKKVGLARALSKLGVCSRSQAAEWIRAGRVRLNGRLRRDPEAPVRMGCDRVEVDETQMERAEKVYLMLNKPRGVVTTASDEGGRQGVYEFLPKDVPWIAPVGRLDKASEGLLLFTNDSQWGTRVLDPQNEVEKIYHVQIDCHADESLIRILQRGVRDRGELLRAQRVAILRKGQKNCWLEIVLKEGKNRQIRRMLKANGIETLRLVRVAVGSVTLGDLAKGSVRSLSRPEIQAFSGKLRPPQR